MIRAASILIENGRLLLVKQEVTATRHWALPGGRLEAGETISQCITRELKEETGLDCRVRKLLYVTDRITESSHLVHMSFHVDRVEAKPLPLEWQHTDPHPSASSAVREIRMVKLDEIRSYGFSLVFCQLALDDFPSQGSYKGDFHALYGE